MQMTVASVQYQLLPLPTWLPLAQLGLAGVDSQRDCQRGSAIALPHFMPSICFMRPERACAPPICLSTCMRIRV